MIIKPAGAPAAFRKLDAVRLVLAFGPDEALARDLMQQAVGASGIAADDPFTSVSLTGEQVSADPARLADEVQALSFLGGRKLIVATGLTDDAAGAVTSLLDAATAGNLLVATAGDLPKRSKLRLAAESSPHALAVVCYADTRAAGQMLTDEATARGLRLDADAAALMLDAVGGERGLLRQEIEKLALYALGGDGRVDRIMVQACIAGVGAVSYDRLLKALFDGDSRNADDAVSQALADGEAMVALLRAVQRRTVQLMRVRVALAEGQTPGDAVRQVQPPIFWKEQDSVAAQARRLSYAALEARLALLVDAEIAVKSGGSDTAGAQALIKLARLKA